MLSNLLRMRRLRVGAALAAACIGRARPHEPDRHRKQRRYRNDATLADGQGPQGQARPRQGGRPEVGAAAG